MDDVLPDRLFYHGLKWGLKCKRKLTALWSEASNTDIMFVIPKWLGLGEGHIEYTCGRSFASFARTVGYEN
jgi:hypothetical protein